MTRQFTERRRGEAGRRRHSGDRFFQLPSSDDDALQWHYNAREGTFGPFDTREQAEAHFRALIGAPSTRGRDRYRQLALKLRRFWTR